MSDLAAYMDLIARKAATVPAAGFETVPELNTHLFPFQADMTSWALKGGRRALFAGTGLGKTLMQLSWAAAVARETRKPVLDLTPLAVAEQTVEQAEVFGIEQVEYCADASRDLPMIPVTNYDRIDRFDFSQFGGVVLDESSILKSHDGKTRRWLTEACSRVPFRLCCSATPAPNDYVELGQHAEFLGIMSAKEMLATWFVHDGSIRATNVTTKKRGKPVADWRLKGHAEQDFWAWVASWAMLVRKPSDLGYDDGNYKLPPLIKRQITVPVVYSNVSGTLFQMQANTLQERLQARRTSVESRCRVAADVVNGSPDKPWLIWCHQNREEELLTQLIHGAVAVRGTDDRETKAQRLLGFARGDIRVLVSKPSICGHGMNFQRCADMVFVGLSDSFEQLYQAIRRCWRFGQTKPVTVYMIASELEGNVVANLEEKETAFEKMADSLAAQIRQFQKPHLRIVGETKPMKVPAWLN